MNLNQKVIFSAAHRLMNTDTVCKYLHGHNYELIVSVTGNPDGGMIIDFFDLEKICKNVVEKYDHATILRYDDPLCVALESLDQNVVKLLSNPTCETIIIVLWEDLIKKLPETCSLVSLKLKEMEQYEAELNHEDF